MYLAALLLSLLAVPAQDSTANQEACEPCPTFPYGRRNPGAPIELDQFKPLLGDFKLPEETQQPDETASRQSGGLRVSYALNGWAVEVSQWSATSAESTLLTFDAISHKWRVTRIKAPEMLTSVEQWEMGPQPDGVEGVVLWSGSPDHRDGTKRTWSTRGDRGLVQSVEELRGGNLTATHRSSSPRSQVERLKSGAGASTQPFGERNAHAPSELGRLNFLIGEFLVEVEPVEGAPASRSTGTRIGQYFLDGWGIRLQGTLREENAQEQHSFAGSLLFDPSKSMFRYVELNSSSEGTWNGSFEGDDLVLRLAGGSAKQDIGEAVVRLTSITESGFQARVEVPDLIDGQVLVSERHTRIR